MPTGTYDPTQNRGKVRLLIGDWIDIANLTFSDASIDAFLEQNSDSVWLAAADACRACAALKVNSSFIIDIAGALSLNKTDVVSNWMELSKKYEERATQSADTIVEYWDSFDVNINHIGMDRSEYVGSPW